MKINFLFNFHNRPAGGGNQFLLALRHELIQRGLYTADPTQATVVLINANPGNLIPACRSLLRLKANNRALAAIFRLDGPISLIRNSSSIIDQHTAAYLRLLADGIVYQSQWSRRHNQRRFHTGATHEIVIPNAPNPTIFNPKGLPREAPKGAKWGHPIKLIATSWSSNPRKGFDVYRYLDTHLDFSRYAMTFVGNTPYRFKNIVTIIPQHSEQLAAVLREHHIYITASLHDPCSNALIEALACGLPAVARKSGGHPELLGRGGELFTDTSDVLSAINRVATNYRTYQQQLPTFSLTQTADRYLNFFTTITQPRAIHPFTYLRWYTTLARTILGRVPLALH